MFCSDRFKSWGLNTSGLRANAEVCSLLWAGTYEWRRQSADWYRIEYIGSEYERLFKENPTMLKEMIYSSQKRLVGRNTIDANHQHMCILTSPSKWSSLSKISISRIAYNH